MKKIPISLSWPPALSAHVTAIEQFLSTTGPDPSALAADFGKRTIARIRQIAEIHKTMEGLGKM